MCLRKIFGRHHRQPAEVAEQARTVEAAAAPAPEVEQPVKKVGTPAKRVARSGKGMPTEIYESISKAAKANNVSRTAIRYCITGAQKTAAGFRWTLCDE